MDPDLAGNADHAPFFGLEELRQRVALIHLEQLRKSGPAAPQQPPESIPDPCGLVLKILQNWSNDNMDVINAAKAQREFKPHKAVRMPTSDTCRGIWALKRGSD